MDISKVSLKRDGVVTIELKDFDVTENVTNVTS
jgi:hypothetical protein